MLLVTVSSDYLNGDADFQFPPFAVRRQHWSIEMLCLETSKDSHALTEASHALVALASRLNPSQVVRGWNALVTWTPLVHPPCGIGRGHTHH